MNLSILQKATKKHVIMEPYPHVLIENALPHDVYDRLDKTWPEQLLSSDYENLTDEKGHTKRYLSNKVLKDKIVDKIWLDFFEYHLSNEFYSFTTQLLGEAIRLYYPDQADDILEGMVAPRDKVNQNSDKTPFVTDVQFVQNKPLSGTQTSRTPHLDNPQEIYAALFYMKKKNDSSQGRDLHIYESINEIPTLGKKRTIADKELRLAKIAPYKPNTVLLFLNCRKGAHSVSTAANTDHVRRHINIIGEYGNGRNLFDL